MLRISHGEKLAEVSGVIERKTDQRPGPLPEIRCEADSIVYSLEIPGQRTQLIIRCDGNGNVTASLAPSERPQ